VEKELNKSVLSFMVSLPFLRAKSVKLKRSDFLMAKIKKYRAVIYLRISVTDGKDGESNSIGNQQKLLEDFVKNNPDIEIVSVKIDDGYSGVIFERPAFKEMMEDIKDGKINCVIVKDLSRLGREYIETGRHLRYTFPAYGVRFISVNDGIDTSKESNSGDYLTVSLKNILNDSYCRDISVKTRSALSAKRKNGDYVGSHPVYGYMKSEENKNRLTIDEYPAGIVKDIFKMKLGGVSAARIADELNQLGVLSPMEYKKSKGLSHPTGGYADKEGALWSATTVIRILKDETYTGTLIQGKQSTLNYKIKDTITNPETEWERTENAHEAIISKEDYNLVQRIKGLDTRTAPNENQIHLFSGMLICDCCGNRMTRKTVTHKNNKYFYYYCRTGKKNGCTAPVMLKEDDLIEGVLGCIKGHINSIISLETILNNIDEETMNSELVKKCQRQIKENESSLKKILKYKTALYENLVNGKVTNEEYKIFKAQYEQDGERLQAAIITLEKEIVSIKENRNECLNWITHFKQFSNLAKLDRSVIIQLVKSIRVVGKTNLDITFNYDVEQEQTVMFITGQKTRKAVV
jgi:DNA invertase Pin-like site-specific DNA recombinase